MEQALPGGGEVFIESSRVARFSKKIEPFSAISFAPFHFSHFQFDGTTFFFMFSRRSTRALRACRKPSSFLSPSSPIFRSSLYNSKFTLFLFSFFLFFCSSFRRYVDQCLQNSVIKNGNVNY